MPWPTRSRRRARLPRLVAALVILAVAILCARYAVEPPPAPRRQESTETKRVLRVVDGDTLLMEDRTRVRLIGVDTPETVKPDTPPEPWGAEASRFTRGFIGDGLVRLEYDEERLDQHGRALAFVWVGERMLNEELIVAGLARAELHFRYDGAKKTRFRNAQNEARQAKRGIWSPPPP